MTAQSAAGTDRLKKELLTFLALLACGFLLLPAAIYLVGKTVFGSYAGGDYFDFSANLFRELLRGKLNVLFLLLSPYLLWQALRLSVAGFRRPPGD